MDNVLVKEISYNGLTEKIAIIGDNANKLVMKGSYVLANKNEMLISKVKKSFLFDDIGIKNPYFKLTILCSIILVIVSGIAMHFLFRV